MSNFEGPLSTQPEWQGHYSYLPPGEPNIFAQPFEPVSTSAPSNDAPTEPHASANTSNVPESPHQSSQSTTDPPSQSRALDSQGLRAPKVESPVNDMTEPRAVLYGVKTEGAQEQSLALTDTPGLLSAEQAQVNPEGQNGSEDVALGKEEDDDIVDDDDDMLEVEGEGETGTQPQTAAERTAARRKMKRFRLTHQQTRFLMSEFAKQPHPDAAHRERLSREIPGLSPRQVQVWFQNRRAKIKRLTADDRDRMIKMRAVPDDFDNVQALHSPYGAVHTLSAPMTPPVDFGAQSYAEHMMRPLMLDTIRRGEGDDHMSPTGLSPSFGSIGFTPSGSMNTPDILSPLSTTSNDRGYYSSHLASPLSSGPRSSNPFARQNSLDTGLQLHGQSRQQIRPLQPLQLRETMSRSRSDNLQSPLRSGMSWKGDSIDYTYQPGSSSPAIGGRHPSLYQPEQSGTSSGNSLNYDSGSYSGGLSSSPTHINYSSLHSATLQQPPQNTRLRAASATLPLGLDLRHQYRSVSSGHNLQGTGHSTPRAASATPYSTTYTSSFPSAPLTAPIDFAQPRTPGIRSSVHDYSMPQMSAPIAPPQDFSQALHGSMGAPSTRTPMRDSFSGSALGANQNQGSNERSDEYSQDSFGAASLKRKRSYSSGAGAQSYPHTS
ncbi:hypothetical protein JX265_003992 [Neoarthrinium moseri]|uniref:Homeobox domain-containing protein n=1 Tax=Neoarthrinium moseri TaxID=1658444 RepID=A0A9P9WRJ4_9PEZI|nr:uncharacterized protein JN550_006745 [Neoarthrinium moseri]KAI1853674.1 hypothetical protein JX266_001658 [Neoarthrinium moseri]KAI1867938.1 hypothetical protein JN550_006745 [Neoarthrinium moseri]KAI1876466.1 hypothetical protein JX265_003992 [Neoarthrinium moseri]